MTMPDIDFNNPQFLADPYPALAELRAAGGPVWHAGLGQWLAARHADANAVLRSKPLGRIYQPRQPEADWETFNWLHADSILDSEPPKQTRLRGLVSRAFNRDRVEALRPQIEKIAHELLEAAAAKRVAQGHFDVIADYAEPLPVKVISALLGIPAEDEHLLRPWSQAIVKMYEIAPSPAEQQAAQRASRDFAAYVRQLMETRKRTPGGDLISSLATVEEAGEKLNAHELIATCVLLLNAGHEASVNGLGNGLVALLQRPDQQRLLAENSAAVSPTAVEEFLRFDAPLQRFERTATEATEINGVIIKPGEKISSLLGAANRDEEIFDHADELNITRNPNPHLAFGAGIHFCLGAALARLELTMALQALFTHFPNLQLAAEPRRRPTLVLRGYESIPVR